MDPTLISFIAIGIALALGSVVTLRAQENNTARRDQGGFQ
jgi:hypothetical protein